MPKTKAIIFDLDGTAIDSPDQKLPTERLMRAIRNLEKDYFLCAATGRPWSHAEPALKGLGLVDACIVASGTQICDPSNGKVLWEQAIDPAQLPKILRIMGESGYNVLANDVTEDDYLNGSWPFEKIADLKQAYVLEVSWVPEAEAPTLVAKFEGIPNTHVVNIVAQRPGFNDVHIMHNLANKEHAVIELAGMLGFDRTQAIGVGDGHNDIALFNAVGHKVAMGNAVIDLKEASDRVIGSIQEDGLAEYFEELAGE